LILRMPIYVVLIAVGLVALLLLLHSGPRTGDKPMLLSSKGSQTALVAQPPDFALALPPRSSLASIAASTDGRYVVLARNFWSDKEQANLTELSLFDLESGEALWSKLYVNPNCCSTPIVKTTPDGQLILGAGKQLHLYTRDGQELKAFGFQEDNEFAFSAEISQDGKYIAAASSRRTYLFSLDGQLLWTSDSKDVPSVALSADGQYLLVATSHAFQLYRTTDQQLIRQEELTYQGPVVTAALSKNGSSFAIAGSPEWGQADLSVNVFPQQSSEARLITLGKVNAPKLTIDERGQLVLVEGNLGSEAALIPIGDGHLRRFSPQPDSVHMAVDAVSDRLAISRGRVVEVRRLSDDQLLWQTSVQGTILALLLSGDRIIALGNEQGNSILPNRVWAWKVNNKGG
jgi:dipeptidyl aminopeptidase/acylaminoacyl peptidase